MNDITRVPDQLPVNVERNDCEVHGDRVSVSLTDKAASAFAWAISLGILFLSTAAVLINIFRRDNGKTGV